MIKQIFSDVLKEEDLKIIEDKVIKSLFEVTGKIGEADVKYTIIGEEINISLLTKILEQKQGIQIFQIKRLSTIDIE